MKKMFRKSTAILSSALIASVLAVPSMTAFAAWPNIYSESIKIKKDIVVTSEDTSEHEITAPDVTYTYAIAPVTVGNSTTVTDKDGVSVNVLSGVTDGVALGTDKTAAFAGKTLTLTDGTGKLTDTFDIVIDASKFTAGAGVYRYSLTETPPADLEAKGVIRPTDYDNTRFIDVYVKMNSSGQPEVYGTVIFDTDSSITAKGTQKTEGFTEESNVTVDEDGDPIEGPTSTDGDPKSGLADKYPLYNYTVIKDVVNDTATKTFNFKFWIIGTQGQKFVYDFDKKTGTDSTGNSGTVVTATTATPIEFALSDEDKVVFKDLPANVKLMVSETNPVANSTAYDVTVSDTQNGTIKVTDESINAGETAAYKAAIALVGLDNSGKITLTDDLPIKQLGVTTFTNTYKEISPTGVLFTVAPFAALAGVGTLFAGLFIKNKKREDSDEMI